MSDARDFVKCLLKMVMEAQPSFTEEQAMQVEQQIRHDWGGERMVIAKRAPLLRASREKVRAQVGTKPDAVLIKEHGISRATLYRWIKPNPKGK